MKRPIPSLNVPAAVKIMLILGLVFFKSHAQPEGVDARQLLTSYKEEILLHHDGPIYLTGDYLRFSVLCLDNSTGLLSPLSRVAYVELLDGSNEPVAQVIVELKDGKGKGDVLLPFTMNSGNYLMRAYTRWMRNFPPENYSHTQVTVINPFKPLLEKPEEKRTSPFISGTVQLTGLSANLNNSTYSNREKAILDINLTGRDGDPLDGVVSVSVSKVPDFFSTPTAPQEESSVKATRPKTIFLPEINGQLVEGIVKNAAGDSVKADALVFLSVTGQLPGFYTSRSDKEGKVRFEVLDFYGTGEVHLQSANPAQAIKVELGSPFSKEFADLQPGALRIDESWKGYLTELSHNMQIRSVYADTLRAFELQLTTDTLPFYGMPDQRYFLDDYTRFPLTEEVLREYVSGIMLRKKDNKFYFKMVDMENQRIMEQDPLILYDGLPVADADKVVEIDPRLIKRIDVMTRKVYMGRSVFYGVTSFHTYDGDLKGLDKKEVGEPSTFEGLQVTHVYSAPSYASKSQKDSSLPDFRTTLFWDPWAQIEKGKARLEFFTGDDTGTYLVSIKGFSQNGERVHTESYFKVEK